MSLSAGKIHAFASNIREAGALLEPVEAGYFELVLADQVFVPGKALKVTATGGEFPPFDEMISHTPAPPRLTSFGDAGQTEISTARDLSLSWSGGEEDALIHVFLGGGRELDVDCTFDASAGSGVIPTGVLGHLSGQTSGMIIAAQSRTIASDLGVHAIELRVDYFGDDVSVSFR